MTQTQAPFTSYQKFVIAILAFLQFTVILDFMIMSPLGAVIMPAFAINPQQFARVVSAYAFSAGASGILAAGFADKYDRKKMLLFFYVGFVVGTLFCAMAPNYHFLLFARTFTGLFGGVIGAVTLAITTDLFQLKQRGQVMGFLQTAFGASQILGIPVGLYLSNIWGWHMPFFMIVAVAIPVGFVILFKLKPVDAHLKLKRREANVFRHFTATLKPAENRLGFLATALISIGGYLLLPFGSAFSVHNLKISLENLPFMYLVSGLAALIAGPVIGKATDYFGKMRTFIFGAVVTCIMAVVYTNLGPTPMGLVMLVNILFFIGIFSRIIPSQALISAVPEPADRGAFMSVNSSLQQVSGGLASLLAGVIIVEKADHSLLRFDWLGYILVGTTLISVFLIYRVNQFAQRNAAKAPQIS